MLTRNAKTYTQGIRHAIVIGGSIAGLMAARVLADYFEQVTLIERDSLPATPEFRKGVPQGRHLHVVQAGGKQILEHLFPGLQDELVAAGAHPIDVAQDLAYFLPRGWTPSVRSGLETYSCSRNLLEWAVRRRVAALDRVRFIQECDTTGLMMNTHTSRVTGVKVRYRKPSAERAQHTDLYADLVVDASGRTSRLPQWLEVWDYAPPAETTVNAFLAYATRVYEAPTGVVPETFPFVQGKPPLIGRGGGILPLEGNRWVVTLGGYGEENQPPTDEAGFLEFARTLRDPIIYNLIKDAKPLTPVYGYARTENRVRHYELLERFPDGLMALGDAVCAFNPIYGQGITTAARGAMLLDAILREHLSRHPDGDLRGVGRRFQQRLYRSNAETWMMATSEDFRYPATAGGQRDGLTRLMHGYLDRMLAAAVDEPDVLIAFLSVTSMVASPVTLFRPGIVWKVLKRAMRPAIASLPLQLQPRLLHRECVPENGSMSRNVR